MIFTQGVPPELVSGQTSAITRRARERDVAVSRFKAATATGALALIALALLGAPGPLLLTLSTATALLIHLSYRHMWFATAEHDSYITHLTNAGILERS